MGRRILLISTIFSVLILSWSLVRLTAPDNCINSSFVEKIDIFDRHGGLRIENCSLYQRIFGPVVNESSFAHRLIARIRAFEKAAFVWQRPEQRISIRITQQPGELNIKGADLAIGRERLNETNDLELSILSLTSPQKDPMVREVIARFFWGLIESSEYRLRPWATYLKTLAGYCAKEEHLLVHREFCDLRKELGDGLISGEVDDGAVGWSLSPLLTDTLKFIFDRLSTAERAKFLERIFFLGAIEDESLFADNLKTLADIEERYFALLRLWLMPLDLRESVLESVQRESSLYTPSYVYIVNESGELSPPEPQLRQAVVETGSRKTFMSSDVPFQVSRAEVFNHLDIKEVIIVGCDMPKPRRLLEFSPWVRKVYFVQKCKDEELDLAGLVDDGALKFAVRQSQLKVYEFNLRSLRVAEKWRGPLRGNTLEDWKNWLEWRAVKVDTNKAFLRPIGVFDAISRFRDPEQNKLSSPAD